MTNYTIESFIKLIEQSSIYNYENSDNEITTASHSLKNILANKRIIINDLEILFDDNIWDFRLLRNENKELNMYYYDFSDLFDGYKIILKSNILFNILETSIHKSIIHCDFNVQKSFLTFLEREKITELELATKNEIEKFLDSRNTIYTTKIKQKLCIKKLFDFFYLFFEDKRDKKLINYLSERDQNIFKATVEKNKTPLLPTKLYNDMMSLFKNIVLNETNSYDSRIKAGALYIQMQTGLRISEICMLEINKITTYKVDNDFAYELSYKTHKVRQKQCYLYKTMPINNEAYNIYILVQNIRNNMYKNINNNYLLIEENTNVVLSTSSLNKFYRTTILQNCHELNLVNRTDSENFASKIIYKKGIKLYNFDKTKFVENDIIYMPKTTQFRVYVASELYERGLSNREISLILGHETDLMWGYYVRPKNEIQNEIDFTKSIINEIISNNTNVLGPRGELYKNQIKDSYNQKKKIYDSIDDIIDEINKEVPIRMKSNGFCIKSHVGRKCKDDGVTDEILCAYGICPNICHMYFMIDLTYEKFKQQIKVIEYDKSILDDTLDTLFIKEVKKLSVIIKKDLEPELLDLKEKIKTNGEYNILLSHPELSGIIKNIKTIEREINEWKQTIKSLLMK